MICEVVVRRPGRGKPYSRTDLVDAVVEFFDGLPFARRMLISLKDSVPGPYCIRDFIKRCDDRLHLGRPFKEPEERSRSCNGEKSTNHIATFASIVEDSNMCAKSIYKLDKTGVTPNKDTSGRSPKSVCCEVGRLTHRKYAHSTSAIPIESLSWLASAQTVP